MTEEAFEGIEKDLDDEGEEEDKERCRNGEDEGGRNDPFRESVKSIEVRPAGVVHPSLSRRKEVEEELEW